MAFTEEEDSFTQSKKTFPGSYLVATYASNQSLFDCDTPKKELLSVAPEQQMSMLTSTNGKPQVVLTTSLSDIAPFLAL